MVTKREDGGAAFPRPIMTKVMVAGGGGLEPIYEYTNGMTLRDYFAAQALSGILAHPSCKDINKTAAKAAAREAYLAADAMIEARK